MSELTNKERYKIGELFRMHKELRIVKLVKNG